MPVAVVALIILVGVAWAASSPVGSGPDDDFHLASIWCGRFADDGLCTEVGITDSGDNDVRIPSSIGGSVFCFVFRNDQSAACQGQPDPTQVVGARANRNAYPDGYYSVMSLLVSDSASASVLTMRIFNWGVMAVLIATAALLLERSVRKRFLLAVMVSSLPLGFFLFSSTNPSGVFIGAITGFLGVAFALTSRKPVQRTLKWFLAWILAGVTVLIAVQTRGDAPAFLLVTFLTVVVVNRTWEREHRNNTFVLAGLLLASVLITRTLGQSVVSEASNVVSQPASSWGTNFWQNITDLPTLWIGSFGFWGLGWLDTNMPSIVGVLVLFSFSGLIYLGVTTISRSRLFAMGLVIAALVAIPLVMLRRFDSVVGQNVQPRYLLPLLPLLLFIGLIGAKGEALPQISRTHTNIVLVSISIAHSVALHTNIRRYVTGLDNKTFNLDSGREWWWAIDISPMTLWLIGSTAFVVVTALVIRRSDTDAKDLDPA
jgi:hypothetical protein